MSKGNREMNQRHEIRTGRSVLARSFAVSHGLRIEQVIRYCETGRIPGGRFDRVLWQWVLQLPVKLLSR